MSTASGYARTVRLWRRGQPAAEAPVIFEVAADRMGAWSGVDHTADAPRIWFVDRVDFFNANLWLGDRTGARQKLDLPTDIWMNGHGDWFAVKPRTAWTVGGKTHAPDTVLGISLSAFLAGSRDFTVVFEPAKGSSTISPSSVSNLMKNSGSAAGKRGRDAVPDEQCV